MFWPVSILLQTGESCCLRLVGLVFQVCGCFCWAIVCHHPSICLLALREIPPSLASSATPWIKKCRLAETGEGQRARRHERRPNNAGNVFDSTWPQQSLQKETEIVKKRAPAARSAAGAARLCIYFLLIHPKRPKRERMPHFRPFPLFFIGKKTK